MPAYNAAAFIDETVDSVLAQDGIDFELLIADDASTDDTRDRLKEYGRHERVRLFFNESNRGAAATRNTLIREARGEDLRDNLVSHGASMSRRALVEQVEGYDESVGSVDDCSLCNGCV